MYNSPALYGNMPHSAIIVGVDVKYRPIFKGIDFHKTSSCLLQVCVHFSVSIHTIRAVRLFTDFVCLRYVFFIYFIIICKVLSSFYLSFSYFSFFISICAVSSFV